MIVEIVYCSEIQEMKNIKIWKEKWRHINWSFSRFKTWVLSHTQVGCWVTGNWTRTTGRNCWFVNKCGLTSRAFPCHPLHLSSIQNVRCGSGSTPMGQKSPYNVYGVGKAHVTQRFPDTVLEVSWRYNVVGSFATQGHSEPQVPSSCCSAIF